MRVAQRMRQNAMNEAELRANAQTILSTIHQSRPKTTTSAYGPKQEEFDQFCQRKQYSDGATVTEEKLLLFLVDEDETRLAWRSVRTYVTAIADLYRTQKALGMNTHPSPREDNVREYLESLQRREAQRDKDNYADKGRDTLLDGYSESEFGRVCHELWVHSGTSTECHFRTLEDLLFGHYLLTRGGDRRATEISDLFTFEFAGEGSTRCMPLIFTTRAGKQNQHGRLETAGAYRNRNPLICILGGLSFYLLCRWDLGSEPFPDFSRLSAYEDQIRRAGRWNQEQMVGCYLNSLPRKFMRTMAGHPPQIGCFEIRRAGVTPPEVLLSMIWPELDRWRGRFGPGTEQENDLAAMGSTNLLFYLREVVLQDSVILMKKYPGSPVWNHPVFRHPAYAPFAQQLSDFILEEERPSQLAVLIQAMPVLADYLQSVDARNEARTSQLRTELTEQLRATEERLAVAQSSLFSSGFNLQLAAATPTPATTAAVAVDAVGQVGPGDGSRSVSTQSSIIDSRATSPRAADTIIVKPEPPPQYQMCRAVKTVQALWINVFFGVMILGIVGRCRIAVVPIVASAAGALANGLCYVAWYSDYPLHGRMVASPFADAAWLVQEAGLPFYSYIILTRILLSPQLLIFKTMFWSLILSIAAIKLTILSLRVYYISEPSADLLQLINHLHIGYFSGTAIAECLSAGFLLNNFRVALRASEHTPLRGDLLKYLMRSTEIRVALLALIGISRTITFTFQVTAQSATTLSGQFDRFTYALETLFPVVMYIDILASRLIYADNARTNSTSALGEWPDRTIRHRETIAYRPSDRTIKETHPLS
ncbi:short-chain dehydrogenase [Purpureocillium lavendulum]|uniref:Short-chain dehydrogenase n=1 Tax=Purpureocillium lavendulum TaxID=1247861 RepID=A0AB34FCR2_9HYPO|nr:short-chain dehydrogenase [Purpureocillium lavendulum]